MDRSPEFQAHQGLTLYFLGKLHSGLKKLSAYYRQRGVKVFNVTSPDELVRALGQAMPHALVIDLQSRSDITRFFDVLGQHEGLLELPRVAIISSTTDQETADALMAQADESVVWPLKATDLSLKLFHLLSSRAQFVRFQRDARDEEGRFFRGEIYETFLRDIIQLLYLGRKDCILSLECEGRRGNLFFKEGKLIDAQVGALEWEDSLGLIRRFRSGTFVLSFQPVERKKFIEKNVAAWLAQAEDTTEQVVQPEADEATAVSRLPDDPEATAPRATMSPAASESVTEESGVILGGAAAAMSLAARSFAQTTEPSVARVISSDPMMPPPPSTPTPAHRGGSNARTTDPGQAGAARGAATASGSANGASPAATSASGSPASKPAAPAPEEEPLPALEPRGRDVKVAVALFATVLLALVAIFYYRARPQQIVEVTRIASTTRSPAPTAAPSVAPPSEPSSAPASPVHENPPVLEPLPAPDVKIREEVTTVAVKPQEQAEPRIRETVEMVPAPQPKPVALATPEPVKPAIPRTSPDTKDEVARVASPPSPSPLPPPTVPPVSSGEVVAKLDPPRPPDPADLPTRDVPDKNLRKARELEKAGKLQEALSMYTQIAELDPSSREAAEAIARLKSTAEVNPLAPGELYINSYPYGIVYIDGEKYGYTPVHLGKATPRKYLIRIVNPELGACSTEVVVKPGEPRRVHLRLDDAENCQRSSSTP